MFIARAHRFNSYMYLQRISYVARKSYAHAFARTLTRRALSLAVLAPTHTTRDKALRVSEKATFGGASLIQFYFGLDCHKFIIGS